MLIDFHFEMLTEHVPARRTRINLGLKAPLQTPLANIVGARSQHGFVDENLTANAHKSFFDSIQEILKKENS